MSKKTGSIYRKVETKTWSDEKFMALSSIPPCGQGLFLYLMTGPFTGLIPGIFRAGRLGMSEELNWEPKAFDEAFQEVFRQGIAKADWKAKLVWLPNAIKFNLPASPNVIISWANEWANLPECLLKIEAYEHLKSSIYGMGEAFGKAFDKAIKKPSIKTCGNQEQEQEQEQEQKNKTSCDEKISSPVAQEILPIDPETAKRPEKNRPRAPSGDQQLFIAWWCMAYEKFNGQPYMITAKDAKHVKNLLDKIGLVESCLRACNLLTSSDPFFADKVPDIGILMAHINKLSSDLNGKKDQLVKMGVAPPPGFTIRTWKFWEESDATNQANN